MTSASEAERLLDGPRARTLCTALAAEIDPRVDEAASQIWWGVGERYARLDRLLPLQPWVADAVVTLVDSLDRVARSLDALRDREDPLSLLPALGAAVDSAMPWQEPFVEDSITALPQVRQALVPVAEAVLAAPAAAWWSEGAAMDAQRLVRPVRDGSVLGAVQPPPVAAALDRWYRNHVESEAQSVDRGPVEAVAGGAWWSTPIAFGDGPAAVPASSTRRLGTLPAALLALEEDGFDDEEAVVHRLRPADGLRVFEVHGADDWATLVDRFPMSARWSRRGVWWSSTGQDADWLVPDHRAVAEEWDAVHVSVLGYLATAGRPIDIGGRGTTVLAGWNPDETYWFTDDVVVDPVGERFERPDDDMTDWRRTDAT